MATKKKSLWQDGFYVRAYELAARGMNKTMIRKDLGVGPETWHRWNKTRPALREAVEKGHKAVKDRETALSAGPEPFSEYIYRTLPPDLLPLWKALDVYKDEENGAALAQNLMADQGKLTRQRLFVHAVAMNDWNMTEAARVSGVSPKTAQQWAREDPDFADLLGALHSAKKDFAEQCAMKLCAQLEPSTVHFVNRALNPERGYDPKRKVEVSVSGVVGHTLTAGADFEKVLAELSPATQREVLEAMRKVAADGRPAPKVVKALPPSARDVRMAELDEMFGDEGGDDHERDEAD